MSVTSPDPALQAAAGRSLIDINERSREIFRRIVESYIATGEPLGSRNLSRILPMTLSPASVRNVMADLEDAGLIYAPHTSAGRLPTETGLRFFVDGMLEIGDVPAEERDRIEAGIRAGGNTRTLEQTLAEATRLLSGLSRGAGVVVTTSLVAGTSRAARSSGAAASTMAAAKSATGAPSRVRAASAGTAASIVGVTLGVGVSRVSASISVWSSA